MKCPCEDEMYLCETPCNRESCAYQQGKNDGRAEAIEELYDLTEKAIKHHAENFIKFGNGAGKRNGKIMGKWLFEYFLEMKIEAEKIIEQLKEQKK